MTTPERLKRRQLIEGGILILLAIFTTLQALYFSIEDGDQRDCFEQNFTDLTQTLEKRGEAIDQESKAVQGVLNVYAEAAGILQDDPTKELEPKDEKRLQIELVEALINYQEVVKDVQRQREANPVPPFPAGTCTEE